MSTQNLNFKYNGDFESLDAFTVFNTQIQFLNIFNELFLHEYPEITVNIRVKGLNKGSLDIQSVIDFAAAGGLLYLENHEYIKKVLEIFGDILKVKKFLKGEKAEEQKEVSKNEVKVVLKGKNITVAKDAINIYQINPVINGSLVNIGKLLEPNNEIEEVEFFTSKKKKKEKTVTLKQSDFKELSSENPYLKRKFTENIYKDQILLIKKPNLYPEKGRKWFWHFLHKGNDVHARMDDAKFKKKIDAGYRLGKGDRIKADLVVSYRYDEKLRQMVSTNRYSVQNVKQIIHRQKQGKFDLSE